MNTNVKVNVVFSEAAAFLKFRNVLPDISIAGHVVKHGLDWTRKTWTGLGKHGLSPGFVKHGLTQSLICKTWTESMICKT